MKDKFLQLSLRERILLIGGIAVLFISGLYAFTYMPIVEEEQRLKKAIEAQQQLQSYLQMIANEVAKLPASIAEPTEVVDTEQSLISIIDTSSEQLSIKPAIKRMTPEGQDKVSLWLEKCQFDQLIIWLAALDKKHSIEIQQITINREQGNTGLVSGKILLSKLP
jgi:general secretion pathway protein M